MLRVSRATASVRSGLLALLVGACGGAAGPAAAGPPSPSGPEAPPERTVDGYTLVVEPQAAPGSGLLQAVSPVDGRVAWVSGHGSRWLRTEDAGSTWFDGFGPAGDSLEFRDVEAFGVSSAYLLSAGPGAASRIYRTDDAGASWRLQYLARDPGAFLDCMAFWDADTGVAYGDAVDGTLFVLRTDDGGASWARVPAGRVPAALEGEGGFAASGTCVAAGPEGTGWIATGNGPRARVVLTTDRGRTWEALDAPVVGGSAAGLAALSVEGRHGLAAGGVIGADTARGAYVAFSEDGGTSWRAGGALAMAGPVYGAAAAPGLADPVFVVVGPGGMDWSTDGGRSWRHAGDVPYWAVAFGPAGVGWAVGPEGRIARLSVRREGSPADGPRTR